MPEHFTGGDDKTVAKLIMLEECLDIYTTIMNSNWDTEIWYIDTHAGSGKTIVNDFEVDGSALRAIRNYSEDFDGFYLYELDSSHFELLHETISDEVGTDFNVYENEDGIRIAKAEDPKIRIMQMDSNEGVEWLVDHAGAHKHWFTFVDPKGLTAKKSTLDALVERSNVDILLTYQTTGVLRSGSTGAEHAHGAVDRTIGDEDWPVDADEDEYVRIFEEKLTEDTNLTTDSRKMVSRGDRRYRFDLIFGCQKENIVDIISDGVLHQDTERLNEKLSDELQEAREESSQSGLGDFD